MYVHYNANRVVQKLTSRFLKNPIQKIASLTAKASGDFYQNSYDCCCKVLYRTPIFYTCII